MTADKVNRKTRTPEGVTWATLIRESEARISACRKEMLNLRKSLVFFRKQESSGVKFPHHKSEPG